MAKNAWWKEQQAKSDNPAQPYVRPFTTTFVPAPASTPVSHYAAPPLDEPARNQRERYIAELEETLKQTRARINRRNQDGQGDQDTLVMVEQKLAEIRG